MADKESCCHTGPGWPSPLEAMRGPREEIVYVACLQPKVMDSGKPDYLATVDVNPKSKTYSQVIHRLKMPNVGDALHTFGWNACSSCFDDSSRKRNRLILPALNSDRIYVVDVGVCREPKMHTIVEPSELHALDVATPHTVHCLASGDVMISTLGDAQYNGKGSFILLDGKTFKLKGLWPAHSQSAKFNYDFWYQPRHNVMISSELGTPRVYKKGPDPKALEQGHFGQHLNIWDWKKRELIQTIDLGLNGLKPTKVRFLHNPDAKEGFVCCGPSGTVHRFFMKDDKTWAAEKAIYVPPKQVKNWYMPAMPSTISDILLSLDDRFAYFSNWFHGDIRQYDITNTAAPKLVGQIFLGGSICTDSKVVVTEDLELSTQPPPRFIKGVRIEGGPQSLHLSLDGKRLYVTNSAYPTWDQHFYPDLCKNGSALMLVDVDTENGGLTLNEDFLINFGAEPDGPVLAHQVRHPGGDCTSDIWL